ncbi:MAG: phosphatidylglycerophosphatase A [Deltaproteobacteria bacterium]|nr:phosphatidylglycerophosphatase A [Deltaproteobacteria bacterium]
MDRPFSALCMATLGPLGRTSNAPGTVATLLAGIPCACLLGFLPLPLRAACVAAVVLVGALAAGRAEIVLGRTDPQEVVIDELAGYLTTMVLVEPTVANVLVGFVLFRIFDIWKPWPVNALQTGLKGGAAIVMDDVAAGIYGMGILRILECFW